MKGKIFIHLWLIIPRVGIAPVSGKISFALLMHVLGGGPGKREPWHGNCISIRMKIGKDIKVRFARVAC